MNKRLKAFTIMEITIAMLVAAIAIGITYTCYGIIAKSYLAFEARQQQLVEISQLAQVLEKDLDKGNTIFAETEGLRITGDNHEIYYNIQPDYILRVSVATDTFKVKTKALNKYFEGQLLTGLQTGDEPDRLDELSFVILSGNDEFPYHYVKQYSSQNLINRFPNANH